MRYSGTSTIMSEPSTLTGQVFRGGMLSREYPSGSVSAFPVVTSKLAQCLSHQMAFPSSFPVNNGLLRWLHIDQTVLHKISIHIRDQDTRFGRPYTFLVPDGISSTFATLTLGKKITYFQYGMSLQYENICNAF